MADNKIITVTMPVEEYERLKAIEEQFHSDIRMFEEAYKQNEAGKDMLTQQLYERIMEIYC